MTHYFVCLYLSSGVYRSPFSVQYLLFVKSAVPHLLFAYYTELLLVMEPEDSPVHPVKSKNSPTYAEIVENKSIITHDPRP